MRLYLGHRESKQSRVFLHSVLHLLMSKPGNTSSSNCVAHFQAVCIKTCIFTTTLLLILVMRTVTPYCVWLHFFLSWLVEREGCLPAWLPLDKYSPQDLFPVRQHEWVAPTLHVNVTLIGKPHCSRRNSCVKEAAASTVECWRKMWSSVTFQAP